jgi:hypothetical protein
LAGVAVNGRALLRHDENGYWMHGVNPGGLSAGGVDTGEALQAFRKTYRTILFDIANDAQSFDEFKTEAVRFFEGASDTLLSEWTEAVQEIREGSTVDADWLPRVNSDHAKVSIDVVLVDVEELEPGINEPDEEPALAMASGF